MTINHETINQLNSLNDNTLKELVNHFLDLIPGKIKKMLEAYYLKDFATVKKEAHLIHTSSTIIGAEILADLTLQIEMVQAGPELDEVVHEKVIKVHKEFQLIQTELKNILNQTAKA